MQQISVSHWHHLSVLIPYIVCLSKRPGTPCSVWNIMDCSHLPYASKKMTPTFGTLFRIAFAAQLPPQIGRLLPQIGIEGFFRRALGLNTHKFPKRSAASLTDLPGLRLRLPELRLCLPSRVNNGKAEQQWKGFRKRASFLKTRTVRS